jgi:hypothetical protein
MYKYFQIQFYMDDDICLYIGAGSDPMPLLRYKKVKLFIYIDQECPQTGGWNSLKWKKFVRRQFISKCKKIGLCIEEEKFYSYRWDVKFTTEQKMYYFFKSYPHRVTKEMKRYIDKTSILYIYGYNPNINGIKELKKLHTIYSQQGPILKYYSHGKITRVQRKNKKITTLYSRGALRKRYNLRNIFPNVRFDR